MENVKYILNETGEKVEVLIPLASLQRDFAIHSEAHSTTSVHFHSLYPPDQHPQLIIVSDKTIVNSLKIFLPKTNENFYALLRVLFF